LRSGSETARCLVAALGNMKTSPAGIALIKHFEGFRSHPYQCQANVWTIGYGHTRGVTPQTPPVSREEAELLLASDLTKYERSVLNLIRVKLTQGQFDALVSFTFNLGGGALQRSTLRARTNRRDFFGAAAEFLKWVRAGGVVSKGLVKRRKAEAQLFVDSTPEKP